MEEDRAEQACLPWSPGEACGFRAGESGRAGKCVPQPRSRNRRSRSPKSHALGLPAALATSVLGRGDHDIAVSRKSWPASTPPQWPLLSRGSGRHASSPREFGTFCGSAHERCWRSLSSLNLASPTALISGHGGGGAGVTERTCLFLTWTVGAPGETSSLLRDPSTTTTTATSPPPPSHPPSLRPPPHSRCRCCTPSQ